MSRIAEILHLMAAEGDTADLSAADLDELRRQVAAYPYFGAAAVALLRHSDLSDPSDSSDKSDDSLSDLRHTLALAAADPRTVLAARYGDEWSKFYPDGPELAPHATVDVIDTFLRTYGSCSPEEEAQLERLIFNPTPDYAELLARQEQAELPAETDDGDPGSQDALINAFIRSQHPRPVGSADSQDAQSPQESHTPQTPVEHPEHTDDSLLSESLAKIFIKQGRYERAFEIISGLNLKFPKKSAYFADQLRFLQKLIINKRRLDELASAADTDKN